MQAVTRSAADALAGALAQQRPYLVRYARRRLNDDALAEDVVQETLLAAWQGAASFEHRAALRTWLTGILQHRIVDAVRAARRRVGDAAPAAAAGAADAPPAEDADEAGTSAGEPVDWVDPARRLEDRQFLGALAQCLDALPEQSSRLFALRTFDGLSNEQAARALGLEPRRAALLLHRATGRIRNALTLRSHGPVAA
jgi:RNA polymerase sigma-70 factor (ECF subfamily)